MIRQLQKNEAHLLVDSAIKFIDQTKYPYGFDLDYFVNHMNALLDLDILKVWIEIDESGGSAKSAIGFVVGPDLFANHQIMVEIFFYGEKLGGLKVIKAAENFAKSDPAIKQVVMASSLYNEERNGQLYKRLGYTRDSSTYRKRV